MDLDDLRDFVEREYGIELIDEALENLRKVTLKHRAAQAEVRGRQLGTGLPTTVCIPLERLPR